MFVHHGADRTDRQNRILAGYLAAVAGFVNTAGLVLTGVVTSHVTGNVARVTRALPLAQYDTALRAAALVGAFFAGAFAATLVLERGRRAYAYGVALCCEAVLLVAFAASRWPSATVLLSAAMGIQNSLVTRLSGAIVRTTHLTGVVTDLAIECARWVRWLSARASGAERPVAVRSVLLATIVGAFALGGMLGAIGATRAGAASLWVPAAAVFAGSAYAFATGRTEAIRPDR